MAVPKSNSPGAGGSASPPPASSPAAPAASLPAKSCRNCAHARLHLITFPDLPEFEQEVRLCTAGSPEWTTIVSSASFFERGAKWKKRAEKCPTYRRKLGAR